MAHNEVLRHAGLLSIEALIARNTLRCVGHVSRMPLQMHGELAEAARARGAPKLRFKESLKSTLKNASLDHSTWEHEAGDGDGWRGRIHRRKGGADSENKIAWDNRRREARRERQ